MRFTVVLCAVLLSVGSAAARPSGLSDGCNELYEDYLAGTGPKVFAHAATVTDKNDDADACGWASNAKFSEAKARAIAYCRSEGGAKCKVVESKKE